MAPISKIRQRITLTRHLQYISSLLFWRIDKMLQYGFENFKRHFFKFYLQFGSKFSIQKSLINFSNRKCDCVDSDITINWNNTCVIYRRRLTCHIIIFQVAGRRNSKVTTTYFWNARNTGLTNLRDLGNPSTAATFWDSKGRLGNLRSIRVECLWRMVWHQK